MKLALASSVVALVLAGCDSTGAIVGSPHGYCVQGQVGVDKFSGVGCPTITRDGETPMGSRVHPDGLEEDMYSTFSDGTLTATGRAAVELAKMKRLEQKVLICGDVVFNQNTGRVDLPGGRSDDLKHSIEELALLDIEYLLPGHMGIVQDGQKVKDNFDFVKKYVFSWL